MKRRYRQRQAEQMRVLVTDFAVVKIKQKNVDDYHSQPGYQHIVRTRFMLFDKDQRE